MTAIDEDQARPAIAAKPARKRLRFFRSQDATPVQDHMPVLGIDAGVLASRRSWARPTRPAIPITAPGPWCCSRSPAMAA